MDPNSGKIFDLKKIGMSNEEAETKGLVPIPIEQREKVQAMNRHERRKWAAEMRHKVMAIPMHEALFPNSKYRDP